MEIRGPKWSEDVFPIVFPIEKHGGDFPVWFSHVSLPKGIL